MAFCEVRLGFLLSSLNKRRLLCAGAIIFLAACSPKVLSDLNRTVERTSSRAEQQARRLDEFTLLKREVDGFDLQTKTFTLLQIVNSDLQRVALARIYFRAFEFQKWTGEYPDTAAVKDELYLKAMEFFLPLAAGIIPEDLALTQRWLSDEWRRLGAIAVAMDEIDPMQNSTARRTGVETASILSLIQEALVATNTSPEHSTPLLLRKPQLRALVQAWRRESIYLLQVRYNYLLAIAAQRLSGRGFSFREQVDTFFSPPEVSSISPELLVEVQRLLDKARDTKEFLTKIGVEVVPNPAIRHRFRLAIAAFAELRVD